MPKSQPPADTKAIRAEIEAVLNTTDREGRVVGNARFGVYAFYDYDGEPIYVGQTTEKLRTRIRRHLTNQRTDAVAMNVLDPFEVCDIEMWPFFDLEHDVKARAAIKQTLDAAEYTVFQLLLGRSQFGAVLNEGTIPVHEIAPLPESFRGRIIPPNIYALRVHPDVRLARRASTIANLSRVISERQVKAGLRRTLLTQARRLEHLARRRFEETGGEAAFLAQRPSNEQD